MKSSFIRLWRLIKRIAVILLISHFLYLLALKWVDPPITVTQLVSLIEGRGLKRDYVDFSEISPHARLAVIAAEDQLFTDHNGFDLKAIKKAMKYNQKHTKRVRGASTISQQVAKNVFLWQGRSWLRKGLEVYFTFMIELIWGKERILEVYLNVAEMGRGVFGIEAAAQYYFKKTASRLSQREAALIAAGLPSPLTYKVNPPSPYISGRAGWIQIQMNNLRQDPDIQPLLRTSRSAGGR